MPRKSEREEGRQLARRSHAEETPLRTQARRIRAKKAAGRTLTRTEAGKLGARASIRSTRQARERAERRGRVEEFEEAHRTRTWTRPEEGTRRPRLGAETRGEVARIRAKKARGAKLTRHEAGVLGGAARVREGR